MHVCETHVWLLYTYAHLRSLGLLRTAAAKDRNQATIWNQSACPRPRGTPISAPSVHLPHHTTHPDRGSGGNVCHWFLTCTWKVPPTMVAAAVGAEDGTVGETGAVAAAIVGQEQLSAICGWHCLSWRQTILQPQPCQHSDWFGLDFQAEITLKKEKTSFFPEAYATLPKNSLRNHSKISPMQFASRRSAMLTST